MKLVNKILVCSVFAFGKVCGQKIKAKDTIKTSDTGPLIVEPPSDPIDTGLTDTPASTGVQESPKETKEKQGTTDADNGNPAIGNTSCGTVQTAQPLVFQPTQQVPTPSSRQEIVYITINPSPGTSTPVKYSNKQTSQQVPETDVPIEHPIQENKVAKETNGSMDLDVEPDAEKTESNEEAFSDDSGLGIELDLPIASSSTSEDTTTSNDPTIHDQTTYPLEEPTLKTLHDSTSDQATPAIMTTSNTSGTTEEGFSDHTHTHSAGKKVDSNLDAATTPKKKKQGISGVITSLKKFVKGKKK